jgi:hypothetical protein
MGVFIFFTINSVDVRVYLFPLPAGVDVRVYNPFSYNVNMRCIPFNHQQYEREVVSTVEPSDFDIFLKFNMLYVFWFDLVCR